MYFSSALNTLCLYGGEGGIRTLDTLLRCTPLAGERLRPLGHLSVTGTHDTDYFNKCKAFIKIITLQSLPSPSGYAGRSLHGAQQYLLEHPHQCVLGYLLPL